MSFGKHGHPLPRGGDLMPADDHLVSRRGNEVPGHIHRLSVGGCGFDDLSCDGNGLPRVIDLVPGERNRLSCRSDALPRRGNKLPPKGHRMSISGDRNALPCGGNVMSAHGYAMPSDGYKVPIADHQVPGEGDVVSRDVDDVSAAQLGR